MKMATTVSISEVQRKLQVQYTEAQKAKKQATTKPSANYWQAQMDAIYQIAIIFGTTVYDIKL